MKPTAYLASSVLSIAMLFAGAAQAMTIPDFDKMNDRPRQIKFLSYLVEQTSDTVIKDKNQAVAFEQLFQRQPNGDNGQGTALMVKNISLFRSIDTKKNTIHTIEDAYFVTVTQLGYDKISKEQIYAIGRTYDESKVAAITTSPQPALP